MFKIHLHERPLVTVQDGALSAAEQGAINRLRSRLIGEGMFLGTACIGCLATTATPAHIDVLTDALRRVLPEVTAAERSLRLVIPVFAEHADDCSGFARRQRNCPGRSDWPELTRRSSLPLPSPEHEFVPGCCFGLRSD